MLFWIRLWLCEAGRKIRTQKSCSATVRYVNIFTIKSSLLMLSFCWKWGSWHLSEVEKTLPLYSPHLLNISSLFHCHVFISSSGDFPIGSVSIPLFSQPPFSFILGCCPQETKILLTLLLSLCTSFQRDYLSKRSNGRRKGRFFLLLFWIQYYKCTPVVFMCS